ncbi:HD domain-containing protein [soil metagenome]
MQDVLGWLLSAPRRALRVVRAVLPSLTRPDDSWAGTVLSPSEYALYLKMDPRDRHHACTVARLVLRRHPAASAELRRAALLHDVGKSLAPYRALERVAVHLYLPRGLPLEPRLRGLRGMWQLGLHHDLYGARLILEAGGSARVAELVAKHHRPGDDAEAQLLKAVDEAL